MAYFLGHNYVNYVCGCGILKPITKIYFCRHCLKIRCAFCVCHEVSISLINNLFMSILIQLLDNFCYYLQVDSHYCVNCQENIPSSEARLRKLKCANCFDCPCCFHALATRATNVALPSKPEDEKKGVKPITRKMYYFACFSCRWTSRDVGIPDQTVGIKLLLINYICIDKNCMIQSVNLISICSKWSVARSRKCTHKQDYCSSRIFYQYYYKR